MTALTDHEKSMLFEEWAKIEIAMDVLMSEWDKLRKLQKEIEKNIVENFKHEQHERGATK
jgi:hypothetical protein